MRRPGNVIINSPFLVPQRHWQQQNDGTLALIDGRRPASYEIYDVRNNTRRVEVLDQVNEIRSRVDAWRADDYSGVTAVTRQLLAHWHDQAAGVRTHAFYFCQLEAVETQIWWVEAAASYRQGVFLQGDGGPFERVCNKMATGSGKTAVMAMLITWQVLNAVTYPKRHKDFSRAVFVVAPGLTVKGRLKVLYPGEPGNAYDEFVTCPSDALRSKLNQAEILVENWHTLMPLKEPDRSVVKKGKEPDEVFTRRVLGKLASFKDIVVINDEAHHAYRKPADVKIGKAEAERLGIDLDEATRWIEGLDRIHKTRRIQRCFDLSATPFAPTGRTNTEEGLFTWVVSDFGLNDAIEAGLVKTPRVVVRDDALPNAQTYRSKLYHLYREPEVQEDLNRRGAEPHEALPKLVQDAYTLLGADWRAALLDWRAAGHASPPVMLTVCNRVETAARIEHYLNHGDAHWTELRAPERTLRVDSRVLEKAEIGEKAASSPEYLNRLRDIVRAAGLPKDREERLLSLDKEDLLRAIVDSVGKQGQAGQALQSVISVAMLSEGWDAKNVTHIMGLRAFTSQLLCEQVIGRGLRRVGYDRDENGLFTPEYVNVFGVPLSVFVDAGEGGETPPPPKPSTQIESLPSRNELEVRWPNLLRVDAVVKPVLAVDWSAVSTLRLDPAATPISAELAPAVGGATDLGKTTSIDLEKLPEDFRAQRIIFQAARKAFDQMSGRFKGNRAYLVFQLIRLVEQFISPETGKLDIPSLYHRDGLRRRILIALNADLVVQHLIKHVEQQNVASIEPVFDPEQPIGSTRAMRTWYTTKANQPTKKSQISHVVGDSSWEIYAANIFESSELITAYAKNDHLGFQIIYLWGGSRRRFLPDFIVRLANGKTLVLEIKGEDSPQNVAKRDALKHWVDAVNAKGGFGTWCWDVAFEPAQVHDIVRRHGAVGALG
ncbi:BPTD_3080 family restriction endonuclease [Leptothrix discophora]|uniref:DEAD/DEAH box helicase family protein n=1 Tax=Leptothrix discophora TaxID=89 RepID=A0ABT9G5U0_LEPDI|nr:DEAD/DEAH box helicase family protein [Leptothrix discophora]MDP4301851.1 DEAD/DEAH box helicase family protein [Leptothrix discophora]